MLKNGLGELLLRETENANRFFDPFSGSGAVAFHVAEAIKIPVIAGDLQAYAVEIANSILLRTRPLNRSSVSVLNRWIEEGKDRYLEFEINQKLQAKKSIVYSNRRLSENSHYNFVNAYGGYYFSYNQAIAFSILMETLPKSILLRSIALSGLIEAASNCAAAPGHTAQPFRPTQRGLLSIVDAWKRDPFFYIEGKIDEISKRYAQTKGYAKISLANDLLADIESGDLVFLDPPYSGVHYSRFYHVLETVARNNKIVPLGEGRYPSPEERPRSHFSMKSKSHLALSETFELISGKGARAILTFPEGECSNGLSGQIVKKIASQYFKIEKEIIKGMFSTLGGNNSCRPARTKSSEMVLLLSPYKKIK